MDENQVPQNDPTEPEAPPTAPEPTPVPPVAVPPVEAPPAATPPAAGAFPPPSPESIVASGTPVLPPAPPAPVAPPSGAVAPPSPPVYGTPAPPAAPAEAGSGKTIAIVIAIVAACALVLAGLGVAIFFIAQSAIRSLDGQTPVVQETNEPRDPGEEEGPTTEGAPELLPLIEGEAGPATAVDPTVCPDECFTEDAFGEIGLDASVYDGLAALAQTEEWGDYGDTTPSKEYTYTSRYWKDNEGTPDECFTIYMQVPIATTLEVRPDAPDDVIAYLGYYLSPGEYSGLQESARLFTDSASAEAHMTTFKDLVAGCSNYEIGSGDEYWTADVSPTPALDLPDSVAAVGWVEDAPFGSRYYAVDLQRGNLVVRAAMYTDGEVTEEDYRAYVEELAQQLAEVPLG